MIDESNFTALSLPPAATLTNRPSFLLLARFSWYVPDVTFSVTDGQAIVLQAISITVSPLLPALLTEPPEALCACHNLLR